LNTIDLDEPPSNYRFQVTIEAPAEEKKWAMSVLSAAAGGITGYLLRR
jgi:hypothetical protein